jgi:DNA-binding IclR family transcriptional regulator
VSARLLDALRESPATVADLADATGCNRDSIRAQLSELRRMGLIREVGRVPVEVVVTRKAALYAVAN